MDFDKNAEKILDLLAKHLPTILRYLLIAAPFLYKWVKPAYLNEYHYKNGYSDIQSHWVHDRGVAEYEQKRPNSIRTGNKRKYNGEALWN